MHKRRILNLVIDTKLKVIFQHEFDEVDSKREQKKF
jgi:hypothetical protein